MRINEITQPENMHPQNGGHEHPQQQQQQQPAAPAPAPAPVQPKRVDGDYEMEDVWVLNPNFNPDDDESPEEIPVTVTYNVEGQNLSATWGYHGGDPAEYAEAEIMSAYDENGVDIWEQLDPAVRDRIQAEADERVQEMESDDDGDDGYYDESAQLEAIKKLSGLK